VSFIVAGGVLLLVLLIGAVFDADDETRENDEVDPIGWTGIGVT
jgi:hypothetical protein